MRALAASVAVSLALVAALPAGAEGSLRLTSPALGPGAAIPAAFTCQGQGTSLPLAWSGVPAGAQSLALVVEDPDAPKGTFTHWIVYDLPPSAGALAAGAASTGLPRGAQQGRNDYGRPGYGPPCPPRGQHHYVISLYALDTRLPAREGLGKQDLDRAMSGHVIAKAELVGVYQKR